MPAVPPTSTGPGAATSDLKKVGLGLFDETFDLGAVVTTVAMVTAEVQYMAVGLRAGMVVGNGYIFISTAGAGVTASLMGLMDASLNRLAVSADQGTAWQNATTMNKVPFTTPVTIGVDGLYYVAAFVTFTVTAPTLPRGAQIANLENALPGQANRRAGFQSAQANIPAAGSFSGNYSAVQWLGVGP